jgi:uncharacterized protein YfaS (alpha-2-macroglobulin family)
MQQPNPDSAAGVPVQIVAVDKSGTSYVIGTATSDSNGNYTIDWTPTSSGVYTIAANFEGTNSYYESSGETHIIVSSGLQ